MTDQKKPPAAQPKLQRPEDEVQWVNCRARKSCGGNQARVILKKNEGMAGTWIQYVCLKCNTPFSIRL